MNGLSSKEVVITLNSFYGIIYGGITIFLLISALIINKISLISALLQNYSAQTFIFNPLICTFKKITGLPCLTCGATRSFSYLAHLRFKDAFLMNPLILLLVTGLLFYGLLSVTSFASGKKELKVSVPAELKRIMFILIIGGTAINWVYLIFICKP